MMVFGLEFDDEMSASRLMWFFVYFGKPRHRKLKMTVACYSKTGNQASNSLWKMKPIQSSPEGWI